MGVAASWYVSPERQYEKVMRLNALRNWGFTDSDIPSAPVEPSKRTRTEVPLLAVYLQGDQGRSGLQRTFDELWGLIQEPDGYSKERWEELNSDSNHLRLASGYTHRPGIRWMMFDPTAFQYESSEHARATCDASQGVRLAGVEGLMATLLFPDWATTWSGTSPSPCLAGLQSYQYRHWDLVVPLLDRFDRERKLRLTATWARMEAPVWASPTVREC